MARPKCNAAPLAPSAPSSSPQQPPEATSPVLPPKSQLIPLREVCRLLGVHENTARRWSSGPDAILKCYRVGLNGQRRWLRSDILAMAEGETEESSSKACLVYCRVSTSEQSSLKYKDGTAKNGSDLQRQVERMKAEAKSRYPELACHVYQECGSAMNYDRKTMNKLLDEVLAGKWDNSILLVENRDRLVRFAAPIIEKILRAKGIEVHYTAQEDSTDDEDFTSDILAVIHFFSARHYSRRVAERRRKVLSAAATQRAKELIDLGVNLREIVKVLDKEELRNEDGSPILYNLLRKTVYHKQAIIEQVVSKKASSAEEWKRQFVANASSAYCLPVADAHAEYEQWAIAEGKPVVSKLKFAQLFGPSEVIYNASIKRTVNAWKGVVVKGSPLHFIYEARYKPAKNPLDMLLEFTRFVRKGEPMGQVFRRYKSFCKEKKVAALSRLQLSEAVRAIVA
ncbi:MAG: IS607 family transposase [Planctomycetaceae bacterium]|nr:IS607 family transposase [Planctomycetaceae bacterium]